MNFAATNSTAFAIPACESSASEDEVGDCPHFTDHDGHRMQANEQVLRQLESLLQWFGRLFNIEFHFGATEVVVALDWRGDWRFGRFRTTGNDAGWTAEVVLNRRCLCLCPHDVLMELLRGLLLAWNSRQSPSGGEMSRSTGLLKKAAECGLTIDDHGRMTVEPGAPFEELLRQCDLNGLLLFHRVPLPNEYIEPDFGAAYSRLSTNAFIRSG